MRTFFGLLLLLITFSVQAQDNKTESKNAQTPNKLSPLWVIDGIKMSDVPNAATGKFLDIDPNNIESISVLKGDSALFHYGEAGRNGVILVTTKKSKLKKSEPRR